MHVISHIIILVDACICNMELAWEKSTCINSTLRHRLLKNPTSRTRLRHHWYHAHRVVPLYGANLHCMKPNYTEPSHNINLYDIKIILEHNHKKRHQPHADRCGTSSSSPIPRHPHTSPRGTLSSVAILYAYWFNIAAATQHRPYDGHTTITTYDSTTTSHKGNIDHVPWHDTDAGIDRVPQLRLHRHTIMTHKVLAKPLCA
jgi:hypothetical protein